MLRLSRHLTLALLWLAIALLPVRGWAAAVMPVGMAASAVAAAHASPADDAAQHVNHEAATPCHDALAGPGETGLADHAGCSLCDVCHSVAAPMDSACAALPLLPEARPRIGPVPGIERPVQSGPERPPRILLT